MRKALSLVLLLDLFLQILRWKFTTVKVVGHSMEPAIMPGSVVIVLRTRAMRVNDVVLVNEPDEGGGWITDRDRPMGYFVKRVKALAGQTVETLKHPVPNDHVYLVGDNSERSLDSRHLGTCPLGAIHGRVVWPKID